LKAKIKLLSKFGRLSMMSLPPNKISIEPLVQPKYVDDDVRSENQQDKNPQQ
jgi:hypothetical protein